MTLEQRIAYAYFSPAHGSFWKWSEDGTAAEWTSRRTIAFMEEIRALVTRLAQTRLPPLSAILLFRAACRDDWKRAISEQGSLASFFVLQEREADNYPTKILPLGSSSALTGLASLAFERLDALASLPLEQRKGLPALCDLAEAFFENCEKRIHSPDAQAIAVELAKGIPVQDLDEFHHAGAFEEAVAALNALVSGAGVPSPRSLDLRKKTGLDEEPQPADISIPDAARTLIGTLRDDPELAGLAQLAHNLLAAVSVPRSLKPAADLPLGGFSDISNRGTLDRLLITELAHDDLTLALRVATNEALYLRRESPPAHPPQRRSLLIDAGVRMWGVPRVFAAAVALAFTATAEKRAQIAAFRPDGPLLRAVDLATREGLIEHLAALDTPPHPAAALPAFTKTLDAPDDTQSDAIIITHEAALADPDFQRHLLADGRTQLLVATVARDGNDGRLRIHQITPAGRRLLSHATLSLDALFKAPNPKRPLLTPGPLDLPVILSLPKLPLLLPHTFMPNRAVLTNPLGGAPSLVMLTHNGRLLRWMDGHQHAGEIARDLPPGSLLALLAQPDSFDLHILIRLPDQVVVARHINCFTGELLSEFHFDNITDQPVGAGIIDGAIFIVARHHIHALHPHTGERLPKLSIEALQFIQGRFFHDGHSLIALATDGKSLRFPTVCQLLGLRYAFDRQGVEGPLIIDGAGAVFHHTSTQGQPDRPIPVVPPIYAAPSNEFRVLAHSPDGTRLAASAGKALFEVDLSLPSPKWTPTGTDVVSRVRFGDAVHWPKHPHLRKNFHKAHLSRDHGLVLTSHKGPPVALRIENRMIRFVPLPQMPPGDTAAFALHPSPSRSFDLKVARFSQGDLFLDSRGMLHLVPRNRSLPQISLVLVTGPSAAWTSTSLSFGDPAFLPGIPAGKLLLPQDKTSETRPSGSVGGAGRSPLGELSELARLLAQFVEAAP